MENAKTTKYSFLESPDSVDTFSDMDNALKNGQHIQNYPHEADLFHFLEKFEDEIRYYYKNLFKVNLMCKGTDYDRYYYLDMDEESRGILKSKSKKLTPEYTLMGILLLKIHRIDKYFGSSEIPVVEFIKAIKQNDEFKEVNLNQSVLRKETTIGRASNGANIIGGEAQDVTSFDTKQRVNNKINSIHSLPPSLIRAMTSKQSLE